MAWKQGLLAVAGGNQLGRRFEQGELFAAAGMLLNFRWTVAAAAAVGCAAAAVAEEMLTNPQAEGKS